MRPVRIEQQLRDRISSEGFDSCGIARLGTNKEQDTKLREYLARGYHGDMAWMAETADRRASPQALWPEARSAVMVALRYGDGSDPLQQRVPPSSANISIYAQGADYHDIIKPKLKRIASWLGQLAGAEVKVFVDTAPLMEKPLAEKAGLGWLGKHTNLVSRDLGSWFFLGAILTTAELQPDVPESDHCGNCQRCLSICPTKAFPAPYQLDARRCISYLTIEHRGHIAPEFREAIGNRIYGCDDCLAVCPWNKFARAGREGRLSARPSNIEPRLEDLLALDDAGFRRRFAGSPIKRTGRDRFVRNVLIAAGNSGDRSLLPAIDRLIADASPVVRAMAAWALSRLAPPADFAAARIAALSHETDPAVVSEWGMDGAMDEHA